MTRLKKQLDQDATTLCRMCIKEYCEGWVGAEKDLECPVCHVSLTIDLTAPALEADTEVVKKDQLSTELT